MLEFEHKGDSIKFEGYNPEQAMDDAKKMFGNLPAGVWVQNQFEPHRYRWVEENSLD